MDVLSISASLGVILTNLPTTEVTVGFDCAIPMPEKSSKKNPVKNNRVKFFISLVLVIKQT